MSGMKALETVLALLRNELWGEELACTLSAGDVGTVLRIAREQMVSGLVANAIMRNALPIGDDAAMEVYAIRQLHEKKSCEMNAEVAKFAAFLNRRNLDYVIIKGQTMAALYPNPLVRSCGDVDFYSPPSSFQSVKRVIEERLGITMGGWDDTKHLEFDWDGLHYEMHSRLSVFGSRRHQKRWNEVLENKDFDGSVLIDGKPVRTLVPTVNAVFLFVHLFCHFIMEGVRLKQLCDWAVYLHAYKDEIDRKRLVLMLDKIGHLKAFMLWGRWIVDHLGLPEEDFPLDLRTVDGRWDGKLMGQFLPGLGSDEGNRHREKEKADVATLMKRTIWVAKQVACFWRMAPREVLGRMSEMTSRQIRLRHSRQE